MGYVLVVKGVMDWTSDAMAIGRLSERGDDVFASPGVIMTKPK